jgi:ribulose 1,5-bisphosphate synthetase/thiazole synthase
MSPHAEVSSLLESFSEKKMDNRVLEPRIAEPKAATAIQDAIDSAYRIIEQPIGTRRALRVVCMGAGYSGLMMAIMFNEKLKNSNATLAVYEKNDDIGGTWLENR